MSPGPTNKIDLGGTSCVPCSDRTRTATDREALLCVLAAVSIWLAMPRRTHGRNEYLPGSVMPPPSPDTKERLGPHRAAKDRDRPGRSSQRALPPRWGRPVLYC